MLINSAVIEVVIAWKLAMKKKKNTITDDRLH